MSCGGWGVSLELRLQSSVEHHFSGCSKDHVQRVSVTGELALNTTVHIAFCPSGGAASRR